MARAAETRDGYAGYTQTCGRCRGTGEARFNHLNGDTHCYLCGGTGRQFFLTPEAKARRDLDREWYDRAFQAGYRFRIDVRRPVREAVDAGYDFPLRGAYDHPDWPRAQAEREALTRRLTFWTPQGQEAVASSGLTSA